MSSDNNPLSRPPTASTALWSHLLRTSTTTEVPKSLKDMPIIVPPMAPLDKNATSMRILLHDTQANFEKFTTHVGKLLENIQETKNVLNALQSSFQRDRETLTGDMLDLVNRSQKEIQNSMGRPAQADAVVSLFKDVSHRLESLDQRLDAINTFNQTHSQVLQTQMQTIQLVLDKQGSIISSVAPLLPLLQGLPPCIDSAKAAIKEEIERLSITPRNMTGPTQASTTSPGKATRKRKRSLDAQKVPSSSLSPNVPPGSPSQKRARTMKVSGDLSSGASLHNATKNLAYNRTATVSSSPSTFPTRAAIPCSTNLGSFLKERRGTLTIQRLTTPRRPLSDLPVPTTSSSSRALTAVTLPDTNLDSRPICSTSRESLHSVSPEFPKGPVISNHSIGRANDSVPIQQSNQTPVPALSGVAPGARASPMQHSHTMLCVNSPARSVHSASRGGDPAAAPRLRQNEVATGTNTTIHDLNSAGRTSVAGNTDDRAIPLSASRMAPISRIGTSNTRVKTPLNQVFPRQGINENARVMPVFAPSFATKSKGANFQNSVISRKTKARRSPLKEGRRFIPLMDSDDEENS